VSAAGSVARAACAVLTLGAVAPVAWAQDQSVRTELLQARIRAIQTEKSAEPEKVNKTRLDAMIDLLLEDTPLIAAAVSAPSEDVRFIAEANRLDKQVGSSSRGSGSTNLVPSGSVPGLLGFAIEAGALTQTVSGTSITLQANPTGIVQALTRYAPAAASDEASRNTVSFLRRFNLALTFDTSRDPGNAFTGSYSQLQQASTQFYVFNHRDPNHPRWTEAWNTFRTNVGADLPDAARDLAVELSATGFPILREATKRKLQDPDTTEADVERVVLEFLAGARQFMSPARIAQATSAWANYLRTQAAVYQQLARSPILTIEYSLSRPPVQDVQADVSAEAPVADPPDLSAATVVFVRPFIGASDMTLNASASFFNDAVSGGDGRMRDWQAGAKLDIPLNGVFGLTRSRLTFAALYMRLRQPPLGIPVTVNGVSVEQTGPLGFLQARLQLPMGDNGVSIPISVTYASRTELVKEQEIRGNIGLTLDFDKLANRRQ
jgi:hypothetical protein